MDHSGKPKPSAPDPAEVAIVDLLQQHIDEATTHELRHKALISEPHAPDHDHRHADPLKPADHFAPDPHAHKKPRKIL